MAPHKKLMHRHYKPYHKLDHLLFQFVIFELIQAHQSLAKISSTFSAKDAARIFAQLVGSPQAMPFFLNQEEGSLTKLKNYCLMLLHPDHPDHAQCLKVQKEADKLWSLAYECAEMIHVNAVTQQEFESFLKKIQISLERAAKQALKLAPQYQNNENVIFFFVRHRQALDAICGNKFTIKLLKQFFEKGLPETKDFLIEKYSARGFKNLVPSIIAKCS